MEQKTYLNLNIDEANSFIVGADHPAQVAARLRSVEKAVQSELTLQFDSRSQEDRQAEYTSIWSQILQGLCIEEAALSILEAEGHLSLVSVIRKLDLVTN